MVFGDVLEEGLICEGTFTYSGAGQASEVVVMLGHAELALFVGGPEGFPVKLPSCIAKAEFPFVYAVPEADSLLAKSWPLFWF